MDIDEAYDWVKKSYTGDVGRFYEPGQRLVLGKGGILKDAVYAAFDDEVGRFATLEGIVYVMTHECDIELENDRGFNSDMLVCPVMPLEDVVAVFSEAHDDVRLVSFLGNLGARNISRLAYIPPVPGLLQYGGVLHLNQITNAPVAQVQETATAVCFLSGYGLRDLEYVLENHLLRPKAERLAFVPDDEAAEVK